MILLEVHLEIHLVEEQVEEIPSQEVNQVGVFEALKISFPNFEEEDEAQVLCLILEICL